MTNIYKQLTKMTCHFIDIETYPTQWTTLVSKFTENDVVYLFMFEGSNKKCITIDDAIALSNTRAKINMVECVKGEPDSLAFQIASYLGYAIDDYGCDCAFKVHSNERCVGPIGEFWRMKGYYVEIIPIDAPEENTNAAIPLIHYEFNR